MINKNILIIQNTDYHFEVCVYLYGLLKNIGYDPYIYRCNSVTVSIDGDDQLLFLTKLGFKIIQNNFLAQNFLCGIIISAYSNHIVSRKNPIPNGNDSVIQDFKNKLIYITHRFKDPIDYTTNNISSKNTLSLSPLSEKINIDHINLVDSVIEPKINFDSKNIKITVQGHFQFKNRNIDNLISFLKTIKNNSIQLNIVGTHTDIMINKEIVNLMKEGRLKLRVCENATNEKFFQILNEETDFILALLDSNTKYGQYLDQRYSTNFCHCMCLEKPIICHKYFEFIYNVPGIYYESNLDTDISKITKNEYLNIVKDFQSIKNKLLKHNTVIIDKKINQILN